MAVQVVAVDMAVYPPSYGVMIGDNIRETEASRLRTRGSVTTQQPTGLYQPSLPNKQTPGSAGCLNSCKLSYNRQLLLSASQILQIHP